jgi:hypothetical protein
MLTYAGAGDPLNATPLDPLSGLTVHGSSFGAVGEGGEQAGGVSRSGGGDAIEEGDASSGAVPDGMLTYADVC